MWATMDRAPRRRINRPNPSERYLDEQRRRWLAGRSFVVSGLFEPLPLGAGRTCELVKYWPFLWVGLFFIDKFLCIIGGLFVGSYH
jgi:hypothetical protein